MSDNNISNDAVETASRLRETAKAEVHGVGHGSPLLEEFSKIDPQQLNDVAKALEKGNSFAGLSWEPQASVRRDSNGDVSSLEFQPGNLDLRSDPRSITVGILGKLMDK